MLATNTRSIFNSAPAQGQKKISAIYEKGLGLYLRGKYIEAEECYLSCIELSQEMRNQRDPAAVIEARVGIATIKFVLNEFEDSNKYFSACMKICIERYGLESIQVVEIMSKQAECYRLLGMYHEAETLFVQSLTVLNRIRRPDIVKHRVIYVDVLMGVAQLYIEKNAFQRVFLIMKELSDICEDGKFNAQATYPYYLQFKANWLVCLGHYEDAESNYKAALTIQQKKYGKEHPHVGVLLSNLSALMVLKCDYSKALPVTEASLHITLQVYPEDHLAVADTYFNKAVALNGLGRYAEAYENATIAFEKRCKCLNVRVPDGYAAGTWKPKQDLTDEVQGSHVKVAECTRLLSDIKRHQGRYVEARNLAMQATNMARDVALVQDALLTPQDAEDGADPTSNTEKPISVDNLEYGRCVYTCAVIAFECGLYQESLALHQQALSVFREVITVLGIDADLDVVNSMIGTADAFRKLSKYKRAQMLLGKAGLMTVQLLGENTLRSTDCLFALGHLLQDRGRYKDADSLFIRCLAIRRRELPVEHPAIAHVLLAIAENFRQVGYFEEGFEPLRTAHAMYVSLFGQRTIFTAHSLFTRAKILCDLGHPEDADVVFQAALVLVKNLIGEKNGLYLNILTYTGMCMRLQGRIGEANMVLRQALLTSKDIYSDNSVTVCSILLTLALLLNMQKKYAECHSLMSVDVLPVTLNLLGEQHPQTSFSKAIMEVADANLNPDKYLRGIPAVSQCLQKFSLISYMSTEHPWVRHFGGYPDDVPGVRFPPAKVEDVLDADDLGDKSYDSPMYSGRNGVTRDGLNSSTASPQFESGLFDKVTLYTSTAASSVMSPDRVHAAAMSSKPVQNKAAEEYLSMEETGADGVTVLSEPATTAPVSMSMSVGATSPTQQTVPGPIVTSSERVGKAVRRTSPLLSGSPLRADVAEAMDEKHSSFANGVNQKAESPSQAVSNTPSTAHRRKHLYTPKSPANDRGGTGPTITPKSGRLSRTGSGKAFFPPIIENAVVDDIDVVAETSFEASSHAPNAPEESSATITNSRLPLLGRSKPRQSPLSLSKNQLPMHSIYSRPNSKDGEKGIQRERHWTAFDYVGRPATVENQSDFVHVTSNMINQTIEPEVRPISTTGDFAEVSIVVDDKSVFPEASPEIRSSSSDLKEQLVTSTVQASVLQESSVPTGPHVRGSRKPSLQIQTEEKTVDELDEQKISEMSSQPRPATIETKIVSPDGSPRKVLTSSQRSLFNAHGTLAKAIRGEEKVPEPCVEQPVEASAGASIEPVAESDIISSGDLPAPGFQDDASMESAPVLSEGNSNTSTAIMDDALLKGSEVIDMTVSAVTVTEKEEVVIEKPEAEQPTIELTATSEGGAETEPVIGDSVPPNDASMLPGNDENV